jgi:hypothetical protein
MENKDQARLVLTRLLAERRNLLPRPAARFLDGLLQDEALLASMEFCRRDERHQLRNSVLVATEEDGAWAALLGHDPDARTGPRPRTAQETPAPGAEEVLDRLQGLPVWFLAVDPAYLLPEPGAAARTERTRYGLAACHGPRLRRLALIDQIDAALDEGDRDAYQRLRVLLEQV